MEENKKEYRKPVMEVLEIEHDNTILTSAGGKNPAHCGKKNKNPALLPDLSNMYYVYLLKNSERSMDMRFRS